MTYAQKQLMSRRRMLKCATALTTFGPIFQATRGELSAQARQNGPNRNSAPSDLKITDIRACLVASNFDYPIIRIDTNQGVYGLGECFCGSTMGAALVLKAHLLGRNPLHIDEILGNYGRSPGIRGSAGHDFWNTGYGAIDLALHDIAGKVYGMPTWRLLGNKLRDRVAIYCDTTETTDPKEYGKRMAARKAKGYKNFKMDLFTHLVRNKPGAVMPNGAATDKGLQYLCEFIAAAKDAIGWEAPLACDHFGDLSVTDAIRYAKAFEPYNLAWAEDLLDWRDWRGYQRIHNASTTKLATGELAFGLEEGFMNLIDNNAVDILHIDIIGAGGLREIKRIDDYAHAKGVKSAIHMACSPIGQIAAAHVAATMQNFTVCETHAIDIPWVG